jgi:hypothetical protein
MHPLAHSNQQAQFAELQQVRVTQPRYVLVPVALVLGTQVLGGAQPVMLQMVMHLHVLVRHALQAWISNARLLQMDRSTWLREIQLVLHD